MTILLRGTGVAGAVIAHLLGQNGIAWMAEPSQRQGVPAIMLADSALALLRDVLDKPDLMTNLPMIAHRMVRWGDGEAVCVPHRALVACEADILGVLGDSAPAGEGEGGVTGDPQRRPTFTVQTTPPFAVGTVRQFGSRRAQAVPVTLHPDAEPHCCWVESGDAGWLFLIPLAGQDAWLLAIGGEPQALLAQSSLVACRIGTMQAPVAAFETAPRMLDSLAGEDWLACGTAALVFDPICGDGTAQATREGILAAAVIRGISRGEAAEPLLLHYRSMLLAAMRRHLQLLLPFYATGGASKWWRAQEQAVRDGHAWCTERLAVMPEPRFVLRGFDLVARELVA